MNGQTVKVNYYKRDRYGRIIGKVLANGADTGLRQIEAGLAWHYKKYQSEQDVLDRVRYANVEIEARAAAQRGREMVSCKEARHYLSACGFTRLDGAGDGVPCEALCQ